MSALTSRAVKEEVGLDRVRVPLALALEHPERGQRAEEVAATTWVQPQPLA
jgi:hypothetical protein